MGEERSEREGEWQKEGVTEEGREKVTEGGSEKASDLLFFPSFSVLYHSYSPSTPYFRVINNSLQCITIKKCCLFLIIAGNWLNSE